MSDAFREILGRRRGVAEDVFVHHRAEQQRQAEHLVEIVGKDSLRDRRGPSIRSPVARPGSMTRARQALPEFRISDGVGNQVRHQPVAELAQVFRRLVVQEIDEILQQVAGIEFRRLAIEAVNPPQRFQASAFLSVQCL